MSKYFRGKAFRKGRALSSDTTDSTNNPSPGELSSTSTSSNNSLENYSLRSLATSISLDSAKVDPFLVDNGDSSVARPEKQQSLSTSVQKPFSSLTRLTSSVDRKLSMGNESNPLGLTLVWEPNTPRTLDIIFVHGLGGTSRETWCKNHDPEYFWPSKWLPHEPEICTARVLTFGYNADWKATGVRSIANISDFAKGLLQSMKFGNDGGEDLENFNLGEVPIIFIVHSMGGLVVKKAYIMGQNDDNYRDMVDSVCSIMFLATPHRGSSFANLLNNVLSSLLTHSAKQYISDIQPHSSTLEGINDDFMNLAPKMQIVSFYETLKTSVGLGSVGLRKILIVGKDSAVLHTDGEIQMPMHADHHEICKYTSRQDVNYINLRNVLKNLVETFRDKGLELSRRGSMDKSALIKSILGVSTRPDDDLNFFRHRWLSGTCLWIVRQPAFVRWMDHSRGSRLLWIHATPACGKSILSSFIINHLEQSGASCQFFFFRFGNPSKLSLSSVLRSFAYQVAQVEQSYHRKLRDLYGDGTSLERLDPQTLWQKLFASVLFKLKLKHVLYWVVDGLDESDSPQRLFDMLSSVVSSMSPIRVLILSRQTQPLIDSFARSRTNNCVEELAIKENPADVRLIVENALQFKSWSVKLQKEVLKEILQRANGNYLWVQLVLEEIVYCDTEEDIQQTLRQFPSGMSSLYARMEANLGANPRLDGRRRAKTILRWACCSRRAMTLQELRQALEPDSFLDLKSSISHICGQFVLIDHKDQVTIIHQTAREYLMQTPGLQFSIVPMEAHEALFERCIAFLSAEDLRSRLHKGTNDEPFLVYAATSWMYHLSHLSVHSISTLQLLCSFLQGSSMMVWIHALALLNQLRSLVRASQVLISFADKKAALENGVSALHELQDVEFIKLWAVDLVKICGRFSHQLQDDPEAIYKRIPQFCPRNSIIYRQFEKLHPRTDLHVMGISNINWDDCLARIPVGKDREGTAITCAGPYVAVLTSDTTPGSGTTTIWDTSNFEEIGHLAHRENVSAMCYSPGSGCFVTCGFQTTKIWAVPTCQLLHSAPNPRGSRALAITFAHQNTSIVIASDDKLVRELDIVNLASEWKVVRSLKEDITIQGAVTNAPCCMSFDSNATQVAVGYRGFPLSVWSLTTREIRRCKKAGVGRSWFSVDLVVWNPRTGHILGRYNDGTVFKWHPEDTFSEELRTSESDIASELQCSPDGATFATCDPSGTIRLWDFQTFSLVYQLSCNNPVIGFVFSPDCRRFYDLRDSFCNVWEPNTLVRRAEADERSSETTSNPRSQTVVSANFEVAAELLSLVTAVSSSPDSMFYCAGNEEGKVELFTSDTCNAGTIWESSNSEPIEHLVWGADSRHVAAAGLSGDITVRHLKFSGLPSASRAVTITSVFDASALGNGYIQQILLDHFSTTLLVSFSQYAQIWSVQTGKVLHSYTMPSMIASHRWVNHPSDHHQLLMFVPGGIKFFLWENLSFTLHLKVDIQSPLSYHHTHLPTVSTSTTNCNQDTDRIVSVIVSKDKAFILVAVSDATYSKREAKRFILLCTDSLNKALPNSLMPATLLPDKLSDSIDTPLGILSGRKLVFLDRNSRICSFKIGHALDQSATLEFCLPRDWLNTEYLMTACLMTDGTFLCPKNGEVAVVKSEIGSEW